MNDVKRMVEERLAASQNPVEQWGEDIQFYIRGPLAIKPPRVEEEKDEWDLDAGMDPNKVLGKTLKVDNLLTTREKLCIENGSTIEIYGEIK